MKTTTFKYAEKLELLANKLEIENVSIKKAVKRPMSLRPLKSISRRKSLVHVMRRAIIRTNEES